MTTPFNTVVASPLGAWVQSALGVRSFEQELDEWAWALIATTIGTTSALRHFSAFKPLADLDAATLAEQYVTDIGYLSDESFAIDHDANYSTDGCFDYYNGHYLLATLDGSSDIAGIVVLDAAGDEVWRETIGAANIYSRFMLVNDEVVWLEHDTVGTEDSVNLHRRAVADGAMRTTIELVDVADYPSASFLNFADVAGPVHYHTKLAFGFILVISGDQFQVVRVIEPTTGVVEAEAMSAAGARLAYGFVKTNTPGIVYANHLSDQILAYDEDLVRVSALDFDFSAASYDFSGTGNTDSVVVIDDIAYWCNFSGATRWINAADRAGNLLRSVRATNTSAITGTLLTGSVPQIALRARGALDDAAVLLGKPIVNAKADDTRETDNSPYTHVVSSTFESNRGNDAGSNIFELLVSPPGATGPPGASLSWAFTEAASLPVIYALSDETAQPLAPFFNYQRAVTCVPSEVHGTIGEWSVQAHNVNGYSNIRSWQTTLVTTITWSLDAAPTGMVINKVDNENANIAWSGAEPGTYTVTVRATSHVGFDTESYELTIEEPPPATEAPVIVPLADDSHVAASGFYLQGVSLSQGDGEITWTFDSGNPSGMIISPTSPTEAVIFWNTPVVGVYTITYRATNDIGFDTDTFELTVT